MLLKSDKEWVRSNANGALAIHKDINRTVGEICIQGYRNICWLGVGGTWASGIQVAVYMKEQSEIETWTENASGYNTTGGECVGEGTIVITSSVTGSIVEVVGVVKRMQVAGAKVTGSIDINTTELAELMDYEIAYSVNEQLELFMVTDRFMQNNGEFSDCDAMYAGFEAHLAQALIDMEKRADAFGQEFAKKHWNDPIHYFMGAGSRWGATYSYATCYWEEQLWIKTRFITSGELSHGIFETITKEAPVIVFTREGVQHPLPERATKLLPRICENYTTIDIKDCKLTRISKGYREHVSHLVIYAVSNRIDAYMEGETRHPVDVHRYYRRLDYQL